MTRLVNLLTSPALALFLCLSITPLMAEDERCACGVEAALDQFLAGAGNGDPTVHDRFWAEDLIYTSSSGERFGKAEIMAGFEANEEPATPDAAPIYSANDVEIRFEGHLALLTFTLLAETPGESESTIQRYYNSGVLRNSAEDGEPPHWQAMLWQATRILEEVSDNSPKDE